MAPQKERVVNGRLYTFGTPHSNEPMKNTTLKYKHDVTVSCLAGPDPAGVTGAAQPFRVRLWGYVYKTADIPRAFGTMRFPAIMNDGLRGRSLYINKAPIAVNADSWLTLPGGHDQAVPKIMPFARYAYNARATDGVGGDYQFRFSQGGVADENENLYFEFDEKDALLIESLGVTAQNDTLMPPLGVFPALARTGLRIAGNYHPKGPTPQTSLYPTDNAINQLVYGRWPLSFLSVFPMPPFDLFAVVPKLDRPYLIWNEIGYVVIRDNGVAAVPLAAPPPALGGVVVAVTGTRIEMRS